MAISYQFYCSSSLGPPYEDRIKKYWKLTEPNVFIGLYDWRDFIQLSRSSGKSYVYWCGGDIKRLNKKKAWLLLKIEADHYCDNEVVRNELAAWGIDAKVVMTFLGDPTQYDAFDKFDNAIHVYSVVRKHKEEEYGLPVIIEMSETFKDYAFHIYGLEGEDTDNLIYHGIVSEEMFDSDTKRFNCCLRPNEFDGFSDAVCKNVLQGGYPITRICYPHIDCYDGDRDKLVQLLRGLKKKKKLNNKVRKWYLENLNDFPFIEK